MKKEYNSPLGILILAAEGGFITELKFKATEVPASLEYDEKSVEALDLCVRELDAYFAGELREFTVPVNAKGTEFRRHVWEELQKIPYGETISYKQLAAQIGNPAAIRAVGGANHNNPVSIIIPCHRVIGANGGLTGYGGGLENKAFLLALEKPKCSP